MNTITLSGYDKYKVWYELCQQTATARIISSTGSSGQSAVDTVRLRLASSPFRERIKKNTEVDEIIRDCSFTYNFPRHA